MKEIQKEPDEAPLNEQENKDTVKRLAEDPPENVSDLKKLCVAEPSLDDDLSEISDDADEILNREEVINCVFCFSSLFLIHCSTNFTGNSRIRHSEIGTFAGGP